VNKTALGTAKPGQSAYRMLPIGIDGLAARLELIDLATSALDLQYYIIRGDASGTLIAGALLRAADRGVRVRVLVDDGETVVGDERLFALAAHPLVQIRVFNPFKYRGHLKAARAIEFLLHKRRLDHRMHNKLMVADNELALIGGRNIGDQYFQIDPDSQFGDDDVTVYGPMVQRLSTVFDEFWNSPQAIPIAALDRRHTSASTLAKFRTTLDAPADQSVFQQDLRTRIATNEPLAAIVSGRDHMVWATAQLTYDSPDKADVVDGSSPGRLIYSAIERRAKEVHEELLMITPYFVPSPAELALLKFERERNVRVELLTNSLESAPGLAAHSGYTHYRPILLDEGVGIHEIRASPDGVAGTGQPKRISQYGNYGLHAKLYIFDRQSLFVGSMNFDQRSKRLNTEIGLLIDSVDIAVGAANRFHSLTQLSNSYSVSFLDGDAGKRRHLVWKTEHDHIVTSYTTEPARSTWQRVRMTLLSWLPLDREL
jgi:cardiolipin synthase C